MRSSTAEHRTPLAWRNRDMTFQAQRSRSAHRLHHHHHHHHRTTPTPSITTSSSDEREEVPMMRRIPHHRRTPSNDRGSRYHREGQSQFSASEPYSTAFRSCGTLRSTRSVPALTLATWDGEPCPVHGHAVHFFTPPHPAAGNGNTVRRHGSLYDMRYFSHPFGPSHISPGPLLEKKSFHGSLQMMNGGFNSIPTFMMPPLMRPRPFVIPAGAEPLPIRDPYKVRTPPASGYAGSKADDTYSVDQVCCKGHLIVLWIILAVVTIGVILGIVLGVTIA